MSVLWAPNLQIAPQRSPLHMRGKCKCEQEAGKTRRYEHPTTWPSFFPPPSPSLACHNGESGNGWKQQIYAQKTDKMQKTRAESTRVGQQLPQTGTDTRRVSKRFSGLRAARFSQNQRTDFTYLFQVLLGPDPTGTGTIAFVPTFGSFTLLKPVSH
jgi:hypothetical protein